MNHVLRLTYAGIKKLKEWDITHTLASGHCIGQNLSSLKTQEMSKKLKGRYLDCLPSAHFPSSLLICL